ncbi:MAG: hypothetical protein ACKOSO_00300, partial [Actinomycetota bacterium]
YPLNGKTTKTTTERWNLIITTQKDNQTVTVKPILKNADWIKPRDTKLFFRLIASKKDQENQMCMANWCQGAKIPVVKGWVQPRPRADRRRVPSSLRGAGRAAAVCGARSRAQWGRWPASP